MAEKKCNCVMMLAGAVIVGLLVGGFVGYWYANQNAQNEFMVKGAEIACSQNCTSDACVTSCVQNLKPVESNTYLTKTSGRIHACSGGCRECSWLC